MSITIDSISDPRVRERIKSIIAREDEENARRTANANRVAVSTTDNQPAIRRPSVATQADKRLDTQGGVCLHFHSRRHRLADIDNLSGKAVCDGLVICGVLPSDSPQIVKEVRHTQEKIDKDQQEETIVEIKKVSGK